MGEIAYEVISDLNSMRLCLPWLQVTCGSEIQKGNTKNKRICFKLYIILSSII